MTEVEWLVSADSLEMLGYVNNLHRYEGTVTKTLYRKNRLFCCACCRAVEHLLSTASFTAVTIAEAYAAGEISDAARQTCLARMPMSYQPGFAMDGQIAINCLYGDTWDQWRVVGNLLDQHADSLGEPLLSFAQQANIVRELWGNVFQPPPLFYNGPEPLEYIGPCRAWPLQSVQPIAAVFANSMYTNCQWINSYHVKKLAHYLHSSWDFSLFLILADAMEEAGCTSAMILGHARQVGEHVKGCWLLDMLVNL